MGIKEAYKIWLAKKANSDFNKIKINSSGSFYMKSEDLFDNKEDVKKYVNALNESLKNYKKNSKTANK